MKITCQSKNLSQGLRTVTPIIPNRPFGLILQNVLLSTERGGLKIVATNLEIAVTTWIGGRVESEGSVAVPGQLLSNIIDQLPDGLVDLEATNNRFKITSGQIKAGLVRADEADFPPFPESNGVSFELPSGLFCEVLTKIITASAKDDVRPILVGVNIKTTEKGLTFAGADGYRLATATIEKEGIPATNIVVPAKSLHYLLRVLDKEEPITITPEEARITFGQKDLTVTCQLIDGAFPDYEKVIPRAFKTECTLENEAFARAVKGAQTLGGPSLRFSVGENQLTIATEQQEVGDYNQVLSAETAGDNIRFGMKGELVIDALNAFGDKVTMKLVGSQQPVLIEGDGTGNCKYVVMPMYLASESGAGSE